MPFAPGVYTDAEIQNHTIKATPNGSEFVELRVTHTQTGEDILPVLIWITRASTRRARYALAKCGFDVDAQDLNELQVHPELLRGNRIDVDAEDRGYGLQGNVILNKVTPERIAQIGQRLREAAKSETPPPEPPVEDIPF